MSKEVLFERVLLSMHANYEVSVSYGSKVMAKVYFFDTERHRQVDRQTGQKFICIRLVGLKGTQSK